MNTVNEVQESIKIALDAADAATDITSEYNKIKNENKKLEASVKQVHKFTTIIFGIFQQHIYHGVFLQFLGQFLIYLKIKRTNISFPFSL